MNKALWAFAASALLAGAAAAQAPAPAPSAPQPPERPALKLKLDEPIRSEPRVTFAPREAKSEQRPASVLPELGGKPSQALERTPSEVVPKDSTPGL